MGPALLVHNWSSFFIMDYFPSSYSQNKANHSLSVLLDGRLIEVTKMGKLSLGQQKGGCGR